MTMDYRQPLKGDFDMPRFLTLKAVAATALVVAGLVVGPVARSSDPGDHATGSVHRMSAQPSDPRSSVGAGADFALASASTLPRLSGYVGVNDTITISKHTVAPGLYKIVVVDDTRAHNWHITGPSLDKATVLNGTGKWVWNVRLRRGTYTIVCDSHAWLKTSLKVTGG